jgi:DNA-binding LacI/PurR family transcriptional regulator
MEAGARVVALTDVADCAGVCPATVSRYLAGQKIRSSEKIRRAIDVSVVKGIEATCRKTPYITSSDNSDEDVQQERAVVEGVANHVDGVILARTTAEQDRSPELLRQSGLPVVCIDRTLSVADEQGGGYREMWSLRALANQPTAGRRGQGGDQ